MTTCVKHLNTKFVGDSDELAQLIYHGVLLSRDFLSKIYFVTSSNEIRFFRTSQGLKSFLLLSVTIVACLV